jgi:predicted RNA polymerase sigma factor
MSALSSEPFVGFCQNVSGGKRAGNEEGLALARKLERHLFDYHRQQVRYGLVERIVLGAQRTKAETGSLFVG